VILQAHTPVVGTRYVGKSSLMLVLTFPNRQIFPFIECLLIARRQTPVVVLTICCVAAVFGKQEHVLTPPVV